MYLLAPSEGDLDLDPVALEKDGDRHHREALLPDLGRESFDLPLLEQKPAAAQRVVTRITRILIVADVAADEKGLAALKKNIRLFEVDSAGSDGLDLGSEKLDPGRFLLPELGNVASLAVDGEVPASLAHCTTL